MKCFYQLGAQCSDVCLAPFFTVDSIWLFAHVFLCSSMAFFIWMTHASPTTVDRLPPMVGLFHLSLTFPFLVDFSINFWGLWFF